jgi:hypothetical protein
MCRDALKDKQVKQDVNHILSFDLPGYQYRQTFPAVFIDDIQYLKDPAVGCAVYHEIIAPNMVFILWSESDAGAVIEP